MLYSVFTKFVVNGGPNCVFILYFKRGNDDEALDLGDVKIYKHINFSNKQGEIQETKLGAEQEKRRNHKEYWDLSHEYETGEATNAYQCNQRQKFFIQRN